jgi:hypothetical protein
VRGSTRRAAVAGYFYPADGEVLRRAVAAYIGGAPAADRDALPPKAIIAPHAGYRYSGPIAGRAYAALAPARGTVRRVLVAGPSHRVRVGGVALSGAVAFASPLGPVEVDAEAREQALAVDGVVVHDHAHAGEHSVEVQLPFVVESLGAVRVLPLLVGTDRADVLAAVLDALWGDDETRIVISTDLSHYLDASTAAVLDRQTAATIVAGGDIGPEQACGATAVGGMLTIARQRGLQAQLLDLRTSADTTGDPDRVVGYGAFAFR